CAKRQLQLYFYGLNSW
nr:immunoglobulin heavy chain junction region [Macaca mulatta]MOW46186.1 immunoglobulin heavy chain junction region [Macaca mulatta]MOW46688.1 immunoglobulin heavy chain junction region [Macaca mulatta]